MDKQRQKEIARQGGLAAHEKGTAHRFSPGGEAKEAGRKGGEKVSQNREHMARIGREGGQARSANLKKKREGTSGQGGGSPGEAG